MDFLYQFNLRLHHFWKKCLKNVFQKLAGLWLVGEVVNHVGLYGSKVNEGCSAFQRRSCCISDWKDISTAHVIIIKSEVSNFPIVILFFRGCVPAMSLIAYTFLKNREFVSIIIVQFMMSANSRIPFGPQIEFVCLCSTTSHYHHCANLSEHI